MDKLDRLVTERLADRLLTPERVGKLLAGLMKRQAAKEEDHSSRLAALRAKLADAEKRPGRLYAAIEVGLADASDATLKERIAAVKNERDIAQVAFDRELAETHPEARITQEKNREMRRCHADECSHRRNAISAGLYPVRGRSGRG
jgi:hypothetical protein